MTSTKISMLEQETIILFNRAEQTAEIFTYDPALKRKLTAMAEEFDEVSVKQKDNGAGGATYILPKKIITIRKPIRNKKLSEEEREERIKRLQGNKRKK